MKKLVVLSLMMFLTFMVFPVWFIPMFPYVGSLPDGGNWAFWCGLLMGIGTFASPLIGMFADRYLYAERVLCLCFVLSGLFLCAAFFATSAAVLFWFLLGAVCFYMPTWALTFTILVLHAPTAEALPVDAFARHGRLGRGGRLFGGCGGIRLQDVRRIELDFRGGRGDVIRRGGPDLLPAADGAEGQGNAAFGRRRAGT